MRLPYCHMSDPTMSGLTTAIREERICRHKFDISEELQKRGIPFKSAPCSCGKIHYSMAENDCWVAGDEMYNTVLDFGSLDVFATLDGFIAKWQEYQSFKIN